MSGKLVGSAAASTTAVGPPAVRSDAQIRLDIDRATGRRNCSFEGELSAAFRVSADAEALLVRAVGAEAERDALQAKIAGSREAVRRAGCVLLIAANRPAVVGYDRPARAGAHRPGEAAMSVDATVEALRALAAGERDEAAKYDLTQAADLLADLFAQTIRVHRLSGEVLKRRTRTLTVYELNRALNGPGPVDTQEAK